MKYIKLFENFESYDPYELMIIPPNKKAEMIVGEIHKKESNLKLIRDLITLGANLDWPDEEYWGRTALHWAAKRGYIEIVQMLIDAKADLDVQDKEGNTPLHLAISNHKIRIVSLLIDAGANLDIQDDIGQTPLHKAAHFENVVIIKLLIETGSKKDIPDIEGNLPCDLVFRSELKNLLKP